MRKCEHKTAFAVWLGDNTTNAASFYACVCGAIGVRSLGPSNDEPEAVRVEMRAAELEHREEWAPISWDEAHGMNIHSGFARGNSPMSSGHYSGLIARELSTHDDRETRDASAWPWDPTRPIADQQPGNANCPRHPTANRHAGAGECYVCYGERMAEAAAEEDKLRDPEAMRRNVEAMARRASIPEVSPDWFDDEALDPVDAKFDVTDEILPDEVAK